MRKFKIRIQPQSLILEGSSCISNDAIKLLNDKKIQFELDVLESEPETSIKPTLIFIHGNSSSKKVFENLIKYFVKQYRVIAYDLLGHGDSSKINNFPNLTTQEMDLLCDNFYNPCSMIAQAIQLFKLLKISHAHILGWSLGGHFAYGIATEDPNLVTSLTTIGSPPLFFKMSAFNEGFQDFFTEKLLPAWIKQPSPFKETDAIEITLSTGFSDPNGQDKFFAEDLVNTDPLVRKYLFVNNESYNHKALDGLSFITNTSIPLCLMVGENDMGIKASFFQNCITRVKNPNSKVHLIKDGSHALFVSNLSDFLKIFESFLRNVNVANAHINS